MATFHRRSDGKEPHCDSCHEGIAGGLMCEFWEYDGKEDTPQDERFCCCDQWVVFLGAEQIVSMKTIPSEDPT